MTGLERASIAWAEAHAELAEHDLKMALMETQRHGLYDLCRIRLEEIKRQIRDENYGDLK